MKSWWDGLPERLLERGLPPTIANALRHDFREFAHRFRAELAVLPLHQQAAAWEIFESVFLTAT